MSDSGPVLRLTNLRVELDSGAPIVEQVNLQIRAGEIVSLVGESGSGKTTTALALLGYAASGVRIVSGELEIGGRSLPLSDKMRSVRGKDVTYVPQDPSTALNPSLRVGQAIEDVLAAHRPDKLNGGVVEELLEAVGLPATREFARRFPHQLSGGQQQRICIAISLACEPSLVILDEPTTGLDVVTQSRILDQLAHLRDERGVAMLYVTHDLSVVAQIADRIIVMYAGHIVEEGPTPTVLRTPCHPYSRGLLASIPDHAAPRILESMPGVALAVGDRPGGCPFAPRCAHRVTICATEMPSPSEVGERHVVRCHMWTQVTPVAREPVDLRGTSLELHHPIVLEARNVRAEHRHHRGVVIAADNVSFTLRRGGSLALVGESGSGKTTLARVIAGLHRRTAGELFLNGEPVPPLARRRTLDQRRHVQLVFQNPADALNPRQTIRRAIGRPASVLRGLRGSDLDREVDRLLEAVRLPTRVAGRYPAELSGGERQRVAIARALAAEPIVLVCDEVTSALDVSVQAAVLDLLEDLRAQEGVALLFITHDFGVVSSVAETVLVLKDGIVCERGSSREILKAPREPYTTSLLSAAPSLSVAITTWNQSPASADKPAAVPERS